MDAQTIANRVAEAVEAAPARAQELIADPRGAVERITGATGFDVTEVFTATLRKLSGSGLVLSRAVDLSKLDLEQIDVVRLDVAELKDAARKLRVDMSKLDMGAIAGKMLGGGSLGGLLGGLFGKR